MLCFDFIGLGASEGDLANTNFFYHLMKVQNMFSVALLIE